MEEAGGNTSDEVEVQEGEKEVGGQGEEYSHPYHTVRSIQKFSLYISPFLPGYLPPSSTVQKYLPNPLEDTSA